MKFLIQTYRQALRKDNKDFTTKANAHNLQSVLYEHSKTFGDLYKYEHFKDAFSTIPISSEYVSFISFWKGVEDATSNKFDIMSKEMASELKKLIFSEDEYVTSMRVFRDEILKKSHSMTRTELFEAIFSSQEQSNLLEFWTRVLENAKVIFKEETLLVDDISEMVFGFLYKRYSDDLVDMLDLERLSTCTSSGDVECNSANKSPALNAILDNAADIENATDIDHENDDYHTSLIYEYKYRKLLQELEITLPKIYTDYSATKTELDNCKLEIENILENNAKLLDEFSKERSDLLEKIDLSKKDCKTLGEENASLIEEIESKELEIKAYKRDLELMKNERDSLDPTKLSEELRVYMVKCDGLQKSNDNLKSIIEDLENRLTLATPAVSLEEDKEQIRELTLQKDELMEQINMKNAEILSLSNEVNDITIFNETLATELTDLKAKSDADCEKIAELLEKNLKLTQDINDLHGENDNIKSELLNVRDENKKLSAELRDETNAKNATNDELTSLKEKEKSFYAYSDQITKLNDEITELNTVNAHLKEKLNDILQENIKLVAKLELMTMPNSQNSAHKIMSIIGKQNDMESTLSRDSETTDCEYSDATDVTKNTVKINPALAETRRLNTVNAVKFGQVSMDSKADDVSKESDKIVHRRSTQLQRSSSIDDASVDVEYERDFTSDNLEDFGISEDDSPDIFQNAISYISKTLNIDGNTQPKHTVLV